MSKNKTWAAPGWPWELDLLSLIFVIIALAVPYYIFGSGTGDDVHRTLQEQRHVLWAIGIGVLFVMHLALTGATLETISTPFLHLFSPVGFAVLAYYRTHAVLKDLGQTDLITGSAGQYALLIASVFVITLVVARIRMARYLFRFRNIQWDIVSKSRYDSSYLQLITEFQPLVYPPRVLRACNEGILIEGWFYLMALPFEMFQGLAPASGIRHASNGRYLASSTRSLIRVELLDNAEPLYISPANRNEFLNYCAQHVAHLRPHATNHRTHPGETGHGTGHGTASGTAHGTARGTAHGTFYNHGAKPGDQGS